MLPEPSLGKFTVSSGLWLAAFAFLSLSGPGRIDIVDGQTRFEVARSLVEHGDSAIRDPRIWFGRFPGRGGLDYTTYRAPQSLLGVPAILLADLMNGPEEDRRHFFFSLTSAAAGATLAVSYLLWFLGRGLPLRSAAVWSVLGLMATPAWFYSTSTFDDVLGATAVVGAMVWARRGGDSGRMAPALATGLLVGLALNCKQPLAVFGLPALALLDNTSLPVGRRCLRAAVAVVAMAFGAMALVAYDAYKFPSDLRAQHAALLPLYIPVWPGDTLLALLALLVSPSAGLFWYCPAVVLGVRGLWSQSTIRLAMMVAIGAFGLFIASMSIFKGDPSWGPRYFLPVYAALWLWAPDGVIHLKRPLVGSLLGLSIGVQVLGLAVDPHRLYVERALPSAFGTVAPVMYFFPSNAHLVQRPRELLEIWRTHEQATSFTPAEGLTFAFPILDRMEQRGPAAARSYVVLNQYRPWWIAFLSLPPDQRPINVAATLTWLVSVALAGILIAAAGARGFNGVMRARSTTPEPAR